jgi:hypothetical protein
MKLAQMLTRRRVGLGRPRSHDTGHRATPSPPCSSSEVSLHKRKRYRIASLRAPWRLFAHFCAEPLEPLGDGAFETLI